MVVMEAAATATRFLNPSSNRNPARPSRCRPPRLLAVRCLQTPNTTVPVSALSCSAVASAPPDLTRHRLSRLVDEFRSLPQPLDRVKRLLAYAASLPAFPEARRTPDNRVAGCTAQVWLSAAMEDELGRVRFSADSDSEIVKGYCSCLVSVLDGALPEEVLEMRAEDFGDLNVVGSPVRAQSRVNTWHNVLVGMQKRTKALIAVGEGRPPVEPFPIVGPSEMMGLRPREAAQKRE